jgi:CPA1 family monovalent cation:H+ antiporter
MSWGGLRGAVTLALALALPTTLEYWWTIQAMAYGVVLFTLFVQAPTVPPLIRRSGLG